MGTGATFAAGHSTAGIGIHSRPRLFARGELAHTCGRLKSQTGFLPERDRRVAHAPWVVCRYRNDEQITVAMFVNDKNRPQLEAAAVRKRQSRQEDVAKIHTRHPQGLSYTESSGP